jgi:hypothetical protein
LAGKLIGEQDSAPGAVVFENDREVVFGICRTWDKVIQAGKVSFSANLLDLVVKRVTKPDEIDLIAGFVPLEDHIVNSPVGRNTKRFVTQPHRTSSFRLTAVWFIESSQFSKGLERAGTDDDFRLFTQELAANPESGDTIPGMAGMRKTRMALKSRGQGKRSGARVIYFWFPVERVIFLAYIYTKGDFANVPQNIRNALVETCRQFTEDVRSWYKRRTGI